MPTQKQIIFVCFLVCVLLSVAVAQERPGVPVQGSSLTITAAAAGDRVRITAPSSVVQIHFEVYGASGEKLFDQEIRGGNVFDWHVQDGQAQRLAPGSYLCVVTVKSVAGRLTQRIGTVIVAESLARVRPAEGKQLSAPQAQAVGPVEENSTWMIAGADEPQTATVIAHDGTDGQMIRGRGALTFRLGDFFSGADKEQMRLTEDGNLGIGTSEPKSKLDVAGTIRAERFLVVRSKLGGDQTDTLTADSSNAVQPLISGAGTTGKLTKWTDGAGTLGDSVVTESSGNIGIGTATPTQALDVANGRIVTTGGQTLTSTLDSVIEVKTAVTNNADFVSGFKARNFFTGPGNGPTGLDIAPTFAPTTSIGLARGFVSAAFFAPPTGVTISEAWGGNAVTIYNNTGGAVTNGNAFAINSPFAFGGLTPTNQFGLHINNQGLAGTNNSYGLFIDAQSGSLNNYSAIFAGGNVGIGTTTPGFKLDVVGRMRVKQATNSATNTAGIWFNQIGPGSDQAFVGMVDDTHVGFFGNTGAGWGLTMSTTSGNIGIGTTTPSAKLDVISDLDSGVSGTSNSNFGVIGNGRAGGVFSGTQNGVISSTHSNGLGVYGLSDSGTGVYAYSGSGDMFGGQSGTGTFSDPVSLKFRVTNSGQVRSDGGFTTPAADFAELVAADDPASSNARSLEPGDVLVISPKTGKLRKSNQPYSTLVAGIYSTKPAFLGNKGIADVSPTQAVPLALIGVVPTKVSVENGAIRPGDLLTTSSLPGYAMKASPVLVRGIKVYRTGTILGKALEPLKQGQGVIKVLVTLR